MPGPAGGAGREADRRALAEVRRVADAVLYEGYVLYPYRASAQKNRSRWQFGVLMPPGYTAAEPSETSVLRAECVFEHQGQPTVDVTLRFLQVQRRRTVPAQAVPDQTAADQTTPDQAVADQTTADQTTPDQPDQAAPDQAAADPTKPDQAAPYQTTADQTTPDLAAADQAAADPNVPALDGIVPVPDGPAVWDEAVEQEVTVTVSSPALLGDSNGNDDSNGNSNGSGSGNHGDDRNGNGRDDARDDGPVTVIRFTRPGGEESQATPGARVTRRREPLTGTIAVRATPLPGPWRAARLTIEVSNETEWPPPSAGQAQFAGPGQAGGEGPSPRESGRQAALPGALVAAHLIVAVDGGAFVSMTDPPEWASPEVGACRNAGCWPVLAGPGGSRQAVLAAPIILPDYPRVAPESPGELYDGTEIDEILTLRTLALSAPEKAAARATDPRAAALIDRVDAMDAATLTRLHAAMRTGRAPDGQNRQRTGRAPGSYSPGERPPVPPVPADGTEHRPPGPSTSTSTSTSTGDSATANTGNHHDDRETVPWWDPAADASVSPGTDFVMVAGRRVARGSRVVLRPGSRRADAQDMFLAGRAALVEAVLLDVDDTAYLAVTLADDEAADLQAAHGRFLYFSPDEVEPE